MNLRYGLLILLTLYVAIANAAQYVAGDVAPKGAPDGQLNAGDLIVLERMILGDLIPSTIEQVIGDIAPLNAPDSTLNAADLLILQRAILGEITLSPIIIGPPSPILDSVTSPTSLNPYQITGTATANTTIKIYVEGNLQHEITSEADGTFTVDIYLFDGNNDIYATEFDGVDESVPSEIKQVNYVNTISRTQGDATSDGPISVDTVWTPGIPVQPYNITSNLTVNNGVTFVIQPGTVLLFDGGVRLTVNGDLQVSNAGGQVIFSSSSSNPTPGSWLGLVINGNANVVIDNALIEWAHWGVQVNSNINNTNIINSTIKNISTGVEINNGAVNVTIDNVLIDGAFRGVSVNQGSSGTIINDSTIQNISQEGILFFREGGTVSNSSINNTQVGVFIRDASPSIVGNNISNNTSGIHILGDGPDIAVVPTIKTNVITNNTSTGIYVGAASASVIDLGNIITDNNMGLIIGDGGGQNTANPKINNNEIYSNNTYNIYAGSDSSVIDATNNWWGSTVISDIAAGIYDFTDNSSQRTIDFNGFLDSPGGSSVTGNYLPQIITGNATLTAGLPYLALGDVRVASDATLTIEAGAVLQFGSSMDLLIEGTLLVNGTPQNPVIFTSSNPVPAAGDWSGIRLDALSIGSIIDGAVVEYAVTGVEVKAVSNDSLITNSVIRNNNTSGIYFNFAGGIASNNIISAHTIQATASGIQVQKASPLIDSNVIYSNKYGIYIYTNTSFPAEETVPQIINNSISNNIDGIYISRTIAQISGNIITNNDSNGIVVFGGAPIINLGNVITNNNFGIYLRSGTTAIIDGNTIVENNFGIFIDANNSPLLQPTITNNDIYDNITSSLYLKDVPGITALNINNNWWGSPNPAVIALTIAGSPSSNVNALVPLSTISTSANQAVLLPNNIIVTQQYMSPLISLGRQDTNNLTADIGQSANWSVEVRDSFNQTVRIFIGTGATINVIWDGKDDAAQFVADGQYSFAIIVNNVSLNQFPFIVDNTMPQVIFDSALSGAVLLAEPLIINGSAFDRNLTNYSIEVADGFAPLESDFRPVAMLTTNVINNAIYNWAFITLAETRGDKTLRLTMIDAAGNSSQTTVQLTLNHPSITNVSHDIYSISPTDGEIVTVSFDLGLPATVSLRFYPENDATQDSLIAEVSQVFATEGAKDISWDGMGTESANPFIPDGAYRFELVAQSTTSLAVFNRTDLLPNTGACTLFQPGNTHAGENKYLNFTCSTDQPARIKIGVAAFNRSVDTGTHSFTWDLRDADGKIIDGYTTVISNYIFALRKDSVIIKGNIPVVTGVGMAPNIEVIATPHTVFHSFEQVSQIVYHIDQDADVSIKLLKPCYSSDNTCTIDHDDTAAITLFDGALQAKDGSNQPVDHSFEWRGYDFNAATIDANDILVNEEGYFTFSIKATSSATGLSTIYRGSIYLGH